MNYTVLQQRLLDRLSLGGSDPIVSMVPDYINEAIHLVEIAEPNGWSWLRRTIDVSVAANSTSIAFGSLSTTYPAISKIIDIKVLDGDAYAPMTLVSAEEMDRVAMSTTTGWPSIWYAEGETLYFKQSNASDATFRMRVLVGEPDLSAPSDTPLLPTRFHGAIIVAALTILYTVLQDSAKEQLAQNMLNSWLDRMRRVETAYVGPTRVRVRDPLFT